VIFFTKELDDWIKGNSIRIKTKEEISREATEYLSKAATKKLNRLR